MDVRPSPNQVLFQIKPNFFPTVKVVLLTDLWYMISSVCRPTRNLFSSVMVDRWQLER